MTGWQLLFAHATFAQLWQPPIMALSAALLAGYFVLIGPVARGVQGAARPTARQVAWFVLAVVAFYVAIGSPVDYVSDHYMASSHMLEHMLLTMAVVPLGIMGLPAWAWRRALRPRAIRGFMRVMTHPLAAIVVFNGVFTMWHAPALYNLTLANDWVHVSEHASMILVALFLWWPMLSPLDELPRLKPPLQLLYLFLNGAAMTPVFMFSTFAGHPLYQAYTHTPKLFGLSPTEDQQLSGVLMNICTDIAYTWAFVVIYFRWARKESNEEMSNLERIQTHGFKPRLH